MFKVLLVDDEPNVRQGIKMMIPWDEIDCEVIGEADDGDDGLNKIMMHQPDIVIADIKMPGKTGIEMTEAAKALGFKGKVLILSGYSDFSYAKTAIALGVENFILKPVDEDELIEAIKTAGKKIKSEREHRYKQEIGREYLNEQLVKGLFAGDPIQVAAAVDEYDFPSYCAAIVCSDGSHPEQSADYNTVRRFYDALNNVDIVSVDISGALGILFKGWKYTDVMMSLEKLRMELSPEAFISCGCNVSSPAEICVSYSEAADFYRKRFIFHHCGVASTEVFKKSRTCDDVLFIDASGEGNYEKGKNQNLLRDSDIARIVSTYEAREAKVDKYSYRASRAEIRENDYNLNIPRYVDTFEEEELVDIDEVKRNIESIEAELSQVRAQMAKYMEELGL